MVAAADCLIVTPRWNPDGGGRERYAAELADAIGRRGVTAGVLTLGDEARAEREIAEWRARRPGAAVLALEAVRGATHYQAHSGVLMDAYAAERWSFPTRMRRAGAGLGLRLNLHRQRRLRRERDVCADPAARVMTFSNRDAASIRRRFGTAADRLVVARPGINRDRFRAPGDRVFARPVRALFAGHNFQLKGLDAAIRALASADCDVTLTVAGGDDPAYCARLARRLGVADRVRFSGPVPIDGMADLYQQSDVLLHPAIHDPFPRVVLEALACGCPVITTTACGASEILSHGQDGWVVEGTDVEHGIARALAALADPDVRRAASRRAADTGRRFDFDAHVTDVLAWMGVPARA